MAWDFGGSFSSSKTSGTQTVNGTKTTQRVISQEGIDKLIYDIMSSDQGLAALASAENASGGYGSSTKTLMAQDLTAKILGEIALLTSPTVETVDQTTKSKSKESKAGGKVGTVICTELMDQGYLSPELYFAGTVHYNSLSGHTVRGYHSWAHAVVRLMKKSPLLCKILAPVVQSRYEMIVNKKFGILGAITIYVGQPICYLIGLAIHAKEVIHGHQFAG